MRSIFDLWTFEEKIEKKDVRVSVTQYKTIIDCDLSGCLSAKLKWSPFFRGIDRNFYYYDRNRCTVIANQKIAWSNYCVIVRNDLSGAFQRNFSNNS